MIAINGIIITEKMHKAGLRIASDLYDASIQKSMGGLGGCKEFNVIYFPENTDLIKKYLDGEIDSVQAMFLAMKRKE